MHNIHYSITPMWRWGGSLVVYKWKSNNYTKTNSNTKSISTAVPKNPTSYVRMEANSKQRVLLDNKIALTIAVRWPRPIFYLLKKLVVLRWKHARNMFPLTRQWEGTKAALLPALLSPRPPRYVVFIPIISTGYGASMC